MTCEYEEIRIVPPKDPSILERLGYEEIEISKTDADGTVTVTVLGKISGCDD